MTRPRLRALLLAFALAFAVVVPTWGPGAVPARADGAFVGRDGDRLVLDGEEFRFVSVNVPNLHVVEDPYPAWHAPDPWEQEDAIASVAQMGGRVVRIYALSVGESVGEVPRHVTAPGVFDEDLFVALDHLLAIAAEHDIKVIVPMVDRWSWWGGTAEYAAFRGLPREAFYSDRRVIQDFKRTLRHVVTRVNTVTGVAYRDDPTILAWETGNELDATPGWTAEIARYIKRLDRNHLVVDGNYGIDPASLTNPDVDIVSNHYYVADPAAAAAADRAATVGQRPLLVGEFGLNSLAAMESLVDEVVSNGTAGALLWSLRFHDRDGGFYDHDEGWGVDGRRHRAYHWPGFPSGDAWDETAVLAMVRAAAYAVQGLTVPALARPATPTLFTVTDVHDIAWRGVAGAGTYDLQRRSPGTRWTTVAAGFDDAVIPNRSLVVDHGTVPGVTYVYRLVARNEAGASRPSRPSAPVVAPDLVTISDPMQHLLYPVSATGDLFFDSANASFFRGDDSRLGRTSTGQATITYGEPHRMLAGFTVEAFFWPHAAITDLQFSASADGVEFTSLAVDRVDHGGDWTRIEYVATSIPPATTHLRITIPASAEPAWTPQIGSTALTFIAP